MLSKDVGRPSWVLGFWITVPNGAKAAGSRELAEMWTLLLEGMLWACAGLMEVIVEDRSSMRHEWLSKLVLEPLPKRIAVGGARSISVVIR